MKRTYSRKWLNSTKQGGTAFIAYSIESYPDLNYLSMSAQINISDCFRSVSLDFHCNDEEQYKERLNKLNILISELTAFKEKYEAVHARWKK